MTYGGRESLKIIKARIFLMRLHTPPIAPWVVATALQMTLRIRQ